VSTPQGPELKMDISTLESPVLLLEVSTPQHMGLSSTWMCLDNSSLCCSPCTYIHYRCLCCTRNCIHTLPELHLDLSSLQSPGASHGWVSSIQGPIRTWSCLDNSSLYVLLLDLSTVYKLQRPVLHSDVSTCWGLSFTWT
jgi:hypothetical protein